MWAHTGKCCQASVEDRKNSEPSEIIGIVIKVETLVYKQISSHKTVKSKSMAIPKEKVVQNQHDWSFIYLWVHIFSQYLICMECQTLHFTLVRASSVSLVLSLCPAKNPQWQHTNTGNTEEAAVHHCNIKSSFSCSSHIFQVRLNIGKCFQI